MCNENIKLEMKLKKNVCTALHYSSVHLLHLRYNSKIGCHADKIFLDQEYKEFE